MLDLKNKKVTVIGFAKSGMACAELIIKKGGKARISDLAAHEKLNSLLNDWPCLNNIQLECAGHSEVFIKDSDLIILSPGVRIDAQPIFWARQKKIPVIGEIELAWQFCDKPVVAVTGSNGKTTVSTLIAKVLERSGQRVCLCGNIGPPFSKYVLDSNAYDVFVLEVSSFQLESTVEFRPHVSVFTNFSQNHLDRHKDLQEYLDAKKRIFLNQRNDNYAVLNYEDETVRAVAAGLNSIISFFNPPGTAKRTGISNPNFLAAMEVGRIFGVSPERCKEVFEGFKGVEHRLELVRSLNGVDFINDSKATTAESGRWALECLQKPIHLICGGRDKNIDFSVLKHLVKDKVKKMYVIGEAKEKFKETFFNVVNIEDCQDLSDAVSCARRSAKSGDCILLTPMCASFDMFANFEERGRVFKDIILKLK